jgi:predicted phage terminase large subunit-like protein
MALSEHMRDEAYETYLADLVSSLQGRKKILKVTTRWHMDDVAGRILPEDFDGKTGWYRDRTTGEPWYVLSIPAAAEHDNDPLGRAVGEYMWPEEFKDKFDAARLRGGYIWSALYQQRPSPEDGLMFTDDMISWYDHGSLDMTRMQIYISSDYAVTAEAGATDPDYTVHTVWAVDQDHNLFLIGGWRGRTTSDQWVSAFIRLCKTYKPLRAFEEQGQIIKGVGPFLKIEMQKERVFVHRMPLTSSVSKEQRAQSLLGLASMGKVYLPRKATVSGSLLLLVEAFEKELLQFPAGKHDDIVDTATLLARGIDKVIAGRPPPPSGPVNAADGPSLDDMFAQHDAEEARRNLDDY